MIGVKVTSEVEKFLQGATLYTTRRILAQVAAVARVGDSDSDHVFLVFENGFFPERPIKNTMRTSEINAK